MNISDTVTWISQSGGYSKEKTGIIVYVVAPRERMDRRKTEEICRAAGYPDVAMRCDFASLPRDLRSFLVIIPPTGKRKPALYWPRVSALRIAERKS